MTTRPEILMACVTCPPDRAKEIAAHVIDQQAAACVNILPSVTSVYSWKGKVETDDECLLFIKFPKGGFARLEAAVRAKHPYEVPEIIALRVEEGHAPYLEWVHQVAPL